MSSGITVRVKMKSYLQDYVIHRYGGEPIKATSSNKLFPLLFPYLGKTPADYKHSMEGVAFELPYNELLNIRYNNYIAPKYFSEIQSYFYGIFFHDFVKYMNQMVLSEDMPIKTAIINFCLEREISFDRVSYDSLKRIYLRYRRKAEKSQKMSTSAA